MVFKQAFKMTAIKLRLLPLFFLTFLIVSCSKKHHASTQNPKDLSAVYEDKFHDSTRKALETKLHQWMLKDSALAKHFVFTNDGLLFYAPDQTPGPDTHPKFIIPFNYLGEAIHTLEQDPSGEHFAKAFTLPFKTEPITPITGPLEPHFNPSDSLPLRGLRVALDPGHLAPNFSFAKGIEKKFIDLHEGTDSATQIFESELTLATTYLLKEQLEEAGATVLLTHTDLNTPPIGTSFYKWINERFYSDLNSAFQTGMIDSVQKAALEEQHKKIPSEKAYAYIFKKLYNPLDFNARASLINDFDPDITVILHYNVDVYNKPWTQATTANMSMVFAAGSFMEGEIDKQQDQTDFLRLLLNKDIENSIEFCNEVQKAFEQQLKIPAATPQDSLYYLERYCIKTSKNGVYLRNLSLTRKIHGTLCYGEPLYQDNVHEYKKLTHSNFTDAMALPRIREVANAYFSAILTYSKRQLH